MEKVVVIGSNSFSGSDFVDHLLSERDYMVIGISRSAQKNDLFLPYKKNKNIENFTFYQLDLNDDMEALTDLLSRERPKYIVNFAAQSEVAPSWEHPDQWFRTNAVAIAALGNYLKDKKWLKRYVHISSPEVYGTCEGLVKEDAPLNPSTPYAASKAAGDFMLFTLFKHYDFPLVMIRSTNVYGAHQQLFKIIPRSIIYIKKDRIIELHGGGVATKSYINIRDISRGELSAMEKGRAGEIYHLSPDEGIRVCDVVKEICESMGKDYRKCTKSVAERLGQDKAYIIDSSKARTEFGWQPQVSMEAGIAETYQWIENNWIGISEEPLEFQYTP